MIIGGGDKTRIMDCVRAHFYQKSTECKPAGRPAYNDLVTKSVWSDGGEDINNGRL